MNAVLARLAHCGSTPDRAGVPVKFKRCSYSVFMISHRIVNFSPVRRSHSCTRFISTMPRALSAIGGSQRRAALGALKLGDSGSVATSFSSSARSRSNAAL